MVVVRVVVRVGDRRPGWDSGGSEERLSHVGEGEKGSVSRYVLGWVFGALVLVMVFVIFGGGNT